jgi:hypothetical protein
MANAGILMAAGVSGMMMGGAMIVFMLFNKDTHFRYNDTNPYAGGNVKYDVNY